MMRGGIGEGGRVREARKKVDAEMVEKGVSSDLREV